tara:strand:- start:872 stop:1708 length:837 start_codon:yes stop_codon:yes gene_type:complete
MRSSEAEYGEPTTDSALALAEARRRRALPGYVSGASILRKLAEPVVLPQPDRNAVLRYAGVPEKMWGMSWSECEREPGEFYGTWKKRALASGRFCILEGNRWAFEWIRDWSAAEGSVYICGPVGTGKSLLTATKSEELLTVPVSLAWDSDDGGYRRDGGVSVYYTDETSLARAQRSHKRHGEKGSISPIQRASECALLVLDDFIRRENPAKGYKQEDADDDLEYLLNCRYGASLPVLITSNSPLDAVEQARGHRVASRLYEMCGGLCITVTCDDWRRA